MVASSPAADGRATRARSTFRLAYRVAATIRARPEVIWSLLTAAADFPRWNTTVQGIEGQIALGNTIKLRATVAPERVFSLLVAEFVPSSRMVWRDGRAPFFTGVRTFTLTPQAAGETGFAMEEAFSGIMLPMIAGSLPDFLPIFERYAADLKREAERDR